MMQLVNGSKHDGSRTLCNRMTDRYAVVNPPFSGKHKASERTVSNRKKHWQLRNSKLYQK